MSSTHTSSQLSDVLADIKEWVKHAKAALDGSGVQLTLATGLMEKARKFAVKTDDVTALCKELNAVYGWLQKADAALRGQPKLDLNEFKKVMEDGEKLKVDQTLLKRMKTQIKNAKAWRAKVKKTGLEKGEATVAELRELLPEAKNIMIDLSDELDVIQAATSKFCICRQVSACVLGRHGVQRVGFASAFRPRAAAAAASAAATPAAAVCRRCSCRRCRCSCRCRRYHCPRRRRCRYPPTAPPPTFSLPFPTVAWRRYDRMPSVRRKIPQRVPGHPRQCARRELLVPSLPHQADLHLRHS